MLNINPLAIKDLESVEALTLESKQIVGPSRFFWKASAPNSCICFFSAGVSPKLLRPNSCCFLEGVSPNLPDRWVHVFGRCQPQTLAARSLGPVFFEASAPNTCCQIFGSIFWGRCQPQTLAAESLGPDCFWKVSASNSCCQISGASLCFGRCQPQTLAAGSLGSAFFGRCQS